MLKHSQTAHIDTLSCLIPKLHEGTINIIHTLFPPTPQPPPSLPLPLLLLLLFY